jgi:hypothetical protein
MAASVVGTFVSRPKLTPGFWFFVLQLVVVIFFAGREEIRGLGYAVVVAFSVLAWCLFRLLFIGPVLSSVLSVSLILTIFVVSKLKFCSPRVAFTRSTSMNTDPGEISPTSGICTRITTIMFTSP